MKAVLRSAHKFVTPILIALAFLFFAGAASSQQSRPTPSPMRPVDGGKNPDDTPLTTFEEEMRAKQAIKLAEKDHQENLDRAREIVQIGKELHDSLKDKTALDRESLKKIERLEKLTKKIRGEAGGEDEEVDIVKPPTDISSAAAQIADASETLSKNVQNTPRQVVSASVIGNANVLLELIKRIRAFGNQP